MSGVFKATMENKTTSVTTHFKKLTTGNNVFIVSVIVKSSQVYCATKGSKASNMLHTWYTHKT